MTRPPAEIDKRIGMVDAAAGNQAYQAISWLLVIDMGVHGVRPEWTSLHGFPVDILVLIATGALVWTVHAWRNQTISRRRLSMMVASLVIAAMVAGLASGLKLLVSR